MAHSLVVGDGGRGTLSVRAKGFVRAEQGINIGTTDATASGTVTVAESGSRLESGTNLTVGQTGRGELEVRGGAAVVVAEVARVWSNSEGASSVQVTGNGSSFSVGRGLVINAGARSASFNVADRATASSESVGLNRNMTGGTSGRAELNVADGGLYKVATDLTLYGQYGPAIVDARSAGRIEIGNVAQAASDGEIRIGAGGRLSGIGQVRGNVVVEPGGTILAGFSPGMLNIVGDATFLPGSVTTLEIGGSEPGMFDQFAATGNVMLGGELVVRVLNGFVPPDDSVLPLILGGSFADVPFSSVTFEGIEPAQIPATWTEQSNFLAPHPTLAGDYDDDFDVDGDDFLAWQRGESLAPLNVGDLEVWKTAFNEPASGGAGASVHEGPRIVIPEPGSGLLLAFAGSIWGANWKRCSGRVGRGRMAPSTHRKLASR